MKNKDIFSNMTFSQLGQIVFVVLILISGIRSVSGQENEPEKLLNSAIYQEEVKGDLQKAMQLYEEIVIRFPENRAVVAEALYRNGLANEKLGNQKARQYYEKVVSSYADQANVVQMAQSRLNRILKPEISDEILSTKELRLTKLYSDPDFYGSSSFDGNFLTSVDWMNCNLYYMNVKNKEKQYINQNSYLDDSEACADLSMWSSDNNKIAYGFSDDAGFHIFIYDVQNKTSKRLISASPDKFIGPVEWSRDGSHLLITRGNAEKIRYQLVSVNNGEAINVLNDIDVDNSWEGIPTISPDLKYILYCKQVDGKRKIFASIRETNENISIVNNSFDNWGMKWDKEGNILFASDRSGSPALYRLKIKNGIPDAEPELVYENISKDYKPHTLSHDGKLTFESTTQFEKIEIAEIESGKIKDRREFFNRNEQILRNPVWSNDGKKIACTAEPSKIYIYNIDSKKEELIDLDIRFWSMGWNQWSPSDNEFMVEQVDINRNNRAIINLTTKTVEILKDLGNFVVFQGENNLIYTDNTQREILIKNRITGEIKTLCTNEKENKYFFLRTSPNQKYLAFFEGNIKSTYWKDLSGLWVLNLETGQKDLIWECSQNEYFGWGVINWTENNENLMVFFGSDKNVKDGVQNDFYPYTVNIVSKEKTKLGKIVDQLNNFNRGDFHSSGNNFIYSTVEQYTNVWLLENIK